MAIIARKDIQSNVVKKLDMSMELPKNRYVVRCKEEKSGKSKSSGNQMVTRVWEIIQPEKVNIGGIDVVIAGVEVTQYLPLEGSENQSKNLNKAQADANAVERYLAENEKLSLPCETVDTENPELACEGVVADAILQSEDTSPRQRPKPGQKTGDPILGSDNKPLKRYAAKLAEILGLSNVTVGAPY